MTKGGCSQVEFYAKLGSFTATEECKIYEPKRKLEMDNKVNPKEKGLLEIRGS